MNGKTILLIEDDKKVQGFNKRLLAGEGFVIITAMTLSKAREHLAGHGPAGGSRLDAIILDIGMPDGNGLDFLRELREQGNRIPVLLLTGYGEEKDVLLGFQSGCDDYLPKPYTFKVLLARLERLLYRAELLPETVTRGALTLNILAKEAFLNGEDLMLTPKDFTLLQYFVQNEEQTIDKDVVYEKVWGRPMAGDSQALGSAVSRLRKKLNGCGYTISAEYGNGYRFERD